MRPPEESHSEMRRRFLSLHALAIGVHALCAAYAFGGGAHAEAAGTPIPTRLHRVRYDGASPSYYESIQEWNVHLPSVVYIHGSVACVTAAFHALLYAPAHWAYGTVIWEQGFFAPRWVEYGITCTMMSVSSLSSSGPTSLTSVASAVCGGAAMQAIGCAIEQRKETARFFLLVGGCINAGTSASTVWYVLTSTGASAPEVLEFVGYTFFYALFPLNCALDATERGGRFVRTDWLYNVLSLSSKLALFWLQVGRVERKVMPGPGTDFRIYGLGIALPLLLLAVGVWWTPSSSSSSSSPPRLPIPSPSSSTWLRRACTFRLFPDACVSNAPPRIVHTRVNVASRA